MQIPAIVEQTLNQLAHQAANNLDVILQADAEARAIAQQLVTNKGS